MRFRGRPVLLAITLAVLGNFLGSGDAQEPTPLRAQAGAPRGAGSCSATACHGRTEPAGAKILRDEHTTWLTRDRHADAFNVLFEERARSIVARLSGGRTQ